MKKIKFIVACIMVTCITTIIYGCGNDNEKATSQNVPEYQEVKEDSTKEESNGEKVKEESEVANDIEEAPNAEGLERDATQDDIPADVKAKRLANKCAVEVDGIYHDATWMDWTSEKEQKEYFDSVEDAMNPKYEVTAVRNILSDKQLQDVANAIVELDNKYTEIELAGLKDDPSAYRQALEELFGNLNAVEGHFNKQGYLDDVSERGKIAERFLIASYFDMVDDSQKEEVIEMVYEQTDDLDFHIGGRGLDYIKNEFIPEAIEEGCRVLER